MDDVAGMSRDLGRDVPDLEKLYARKLWADFSYPNFTTVSKYFGQLLLCSSQIDFFLELLGFGKKCEQRIAESLTELFCELYLAIWVEELPKVTEPKLFRNQFGNLFVCTSAANLLQTFMSSIVLRGNSFCKFCKSTLH